MATAFAVYCDTDKSLNFYKRDSVPSAGSDFEGKVATNVYTGFEDVEYTSQKAPWYDLRASVTNITFIDEISPISTIWWFRRFSNLISIDLINLNTSNVTNMGYMFYACTALTTLDLSSFNTSNVTDMSRMFYGCTALTNLDISNWNTSNVTNMYAMFHNCLALITLDVSGFDTSKVINMSDMFYGCKALTNLDVSNFNTSNVTDMSQMFSNCEVLSIIYVSDKWSVSEVTSGDGMFRNCYKLVGAVPYNSTKLNHTMANYETGYLTLKPPLDYFISDIVLTDLGDAVRKATQTTEKLLPSQMIDILNTIGVSAIDDGNGNITITIIPGTVSHDNAGNVTIS